MRITSGKSSKGYGNISFMPIKCIFSATSIEYLGFIVGTEGVSMDPDHVTTVTEWPQPTSFMEVQQCLGFANFYRQFIFQYSKVVAPITDLLKGSKRGKKMGPFEFPLSACKAFERLKTAFSTALVLHHFNPEVRTWLQTDASGFAL